MLGYQHDFLEFFLKNEDEYTKQGWVRVDRLLPGVNQYREVLGCTCLDKVTLVKDRARLVRHGSIFYFETEEYAGSYLTVLYWMPCNDDKRRLRELNRPNTPIDNNQLASYELDGHKYAVFRSVAGVAMVHAESCECKEGER